MKLYNEFVLIVTDTMKTANCLTNKAGKCKFKE